jgi:hypothetical protein
MFPFLCITGALRRKPNKWHPPCRLSSLDISHQLLAQKTRNVQYQYLDVMDLSEYLTDFRNRCRSRKDKCDGAKPACSTCVSNGRVCSYDANVKKRGLPEGYVRGLEKLWGLALRDVDGVENNMLDAMNGQQKKFDHQDWNDETGSESLVKLWRKSQLSQELERLLSSVEITTIAESSKRKR